METRGFVRALRIALDSNILLYLARVWRVDADKGKTSRIESVLEQIDTRATLVVPAQTLGEAYTVMQRFGYGRETCRRIIHRWAETFETAGSSDGAFITGLDLAVDHKLQFWDALILNVSAEAGCKMLLSEDTQSGFEWCGVRVVNPFAEALDVRLTRLMN
jgi:predicted nucleic acid-binding protein